MDFLERAFAWLLQILSVFQSSYNVQTASGFFLFFFLFVCFFNVSLAKGEFGAFQSAILLSTSAP